MPKPIAPMLEPLQPRTLLSAAPSFRHSTHNLVDPRDYPIVTTVGRLAFVNGLGTGVNSPLVEVYNARRGKWFATSPSSTADLVAKPLVVGTKLYFPEYVGNDGGLAVYDTATGGWSSVAAPQQVMQTQGVVVGSKLVFAGGAVFTTHSVTPLDAVSIYDTATGQWSSATLSQARFQITPAVVGTKAIFAGGRVVGNANVPTDVPSDAVDVYDAVTGQWSTAKLSLARYDMAAAVVNGTVLFAGGKRQRPGQSPRATAAVDIFSAGTGRWSTATLSAPRAEAAVAVVGGKAVFAGGLTGPDLDTPVAAVDVFNPVKKNHWSTARLSAAHAPAVAVVGNVAVFAGDIGDSAGSSTVVDVYDAATNRWSTAPALSQARAGLAGGAVSGVLLFAGGAADPKGEYSPVVDLYTLA